jgi:hypothetical protein
LASTNGGYGLNASAGGYFDSSGVGYNPFTGVHIAMLNKSSNCSVGDILVDSRIVVTTISDSFSEVELSTDPEQKAPLGVLQKKQTDWVVPPAFIDREATELEKEIIISERQVYYDNGEEIPKDSPSWRDPTVLTSDPSIYYEDYNLVNINAVGEGSINVCGEAGDISKGDLIVTSSMAGKGMKQSDDIVRSYTVAKAREDVTFSSPTELKMVACIYLCG